MINPVTPSARALAIDLLTDVTEKAAYAGISLRQALRGIEMDTREKALATELLNGTLRNLIHIDYILDAFSQTPTRKMKPFILNVLRVSVYQLRFMDRIPPSAAVNEAVNLVKARGFTSLSGFVNGVLRAVARTTDKPLIPSFENEPVRHIALHYSFPEWLVKELIDRLGLERAKNFCQNSHCPPVVTVFTHFLKTDKLTDALTSENVDCEPGMLHRECLRLRHTGNMADLSAFKKGMFYVMDEGALTAVKALDPKPGQEIYDLCAAPGGKSFAIACLTNDRANIRAFDIHPHKIKLINETSARLGLHSVTAVIGDATESNPALTGRADAVLLDAPCSGLGILKKQPDIKYTRTFKDIRVLAEKQRSMLAAAASYVKPGGVLVYCTCTVTREENTDNIRWFTAQYPFHTEAPPENIWTDPNNPVEYFIEENGLQLLPGLSNDGFFIAKLVRDL